MNSRMYGEKLRYIDSQITNIKMPGAQSISDKEKLISECDRTIAEMRELLKHETDAKKIARINEIIKNQQEKKARERQAIAVFKAHDLKSQKEMDRLRQVQELLKNTGKQH